jgi:hypothetical protein
LEATTFTLIVLLVAGDADDAGARALARAARDAMGDDAAVALRATKVPPTDPEMLGIETSEHAFAVAEVSWADDTHLHAVVHLHLADGRRWIDRTIEFTPTDAPDEKGRTIGFALASMLPERPPPPAPEPTLALPAPAPPAPAEPPRTIAAPPPRVWHGALDVAAAGTQATSGPGGTIGGMVGATWFPSPPWGLRASTALRSGRLEAADATIFIVDAAVGATWRWLPPLPSRPFSLGLGTDLFARRLQLSRQSPSDLRNTHLSRWLPAVDLALEGTWSLGEGAAFFASAGGVAAMGSTDVFIEDQHVATLSPISLQLEGGIEARF